jgi:adenylosuccinate synthase
MTKIAIIGMQWGDEGKGKVIDHLLSNEKYDVVARYGGGRNAGHTQVDEDGREAITHLLPQGVLKPNVYNLILADVMIDPPGLIEEIRELQEMGHRVGPENLGISDRAQITLQYHKDFERKQERRKGRKAVGTTMRGIGPTAVSKYGREPLTFEEFANPASFRRFLESLPKSHYNLPGFLRSLASRSGNIVASGVNVRKYLEMYGQSADFLRPFRTNEAEVVDRMKERNWVYEGAQGILLDVLYGSIPYVTSSTPHNPPSDTNWRIGVAKAYITRVGGGNLPTRMEPDGEEKIRGVRGETPGAEFGATTGRPRKCGWFDAVATRHSACIGRINEIQLTKLDRLSGFPEIRVGTGYRVRGGVIKHFPADRFDFEEARAVYEEYPGWPDDISGCREPGDLPRNAIDYVKRVEDMMRCEITSVSVGPKAEQTIGLV